MEKENIRLDQFTEYRTATARLIEAQQELERVEKRINTLQREVGSPHASTMVEKAQAWLRGEPVAISPGKSLHEELTQARETRRMLHSALNLQRREIAELTSHLSRKICEKIKPEYIDIVQRMVHAVQTLAKIIDEEAEFRETLSANDVEYASWLPPVTFSQVGRLSDPHSNANWFLNEARTYYLDPTPTEREKKPTVAQRLKKVVADDDWVSD